MNVSALTSGTLLRGAPGTRYVYAAWALAAVVALLQGVAARTLGGDGVTAEFLLRWRLYPVALWAAVTPVVLAAGRRWPVPADGWPGNLAVHAVLFPAWMVLSNLLLRVPDLVAAGPTGIGPASVWAAVEYAPTGAVVWTGLVAVGRRRGPRRTGDARSAGSGSRTRRVFTASSGEGGSDGDAAEATGGRGRAPLSLREGYRTHLVPREAVRWVEADGDYLRVHTAERSYRVRGPMKAFLSRLDDDRFLRIHRSTLVNIDFVREVQPYFHGDWMAILRDGTELRVPRTRRAALRRLRGRR